MWNLAEPEPSFRQALRGFRCHLDLRVARHTGELDKGYDAKAAVWRAKLPAETTTEPAD
jgi:hypothetical protein